LAEFFAQELPTCESGQAARCRDQSVVSGLREGGRSGHRQEHPYDQGSGRNPAETREMCHGVLLSDW
jgi:hypothetical protein